MKQQKVHLVSAFTDNGTGGNCAGVVLQAQHLTALEKQTIAHKVGLSETAFVSPSSKADVLVEFFTPTRQIPHCGHATVATFGYLAKTGFLKDGEATRESIEGVHPVCLRGEHIFLHQQAPAFFGSDPALGKRALAALGLTKDDLFPNCEAEIVNTGVNFLLIPLRNTQALHDIQPRLLEIEALSEDHSLIGFYPFAPTTQPHQIHAFARMFAPSYGIPEESATGMAAGPLASFLNFRMGFSQTRFFIGQGHHMNPASPSTLEVSLKKNDGQIREVWVGGESVWDKDLWIRYAPEQQAS